MSIPTVSPSSARIIITPDEGVGPANIASPIANGQQKEVSSEMIEKLKAFVQDFQRRAGVEQTPVSVEHREQITERTNVPPGFARVLFRLNEETGAIELVSVSDASTPTT